LADLEPYATRTAPDRDAAPRAPIACTCRPHGRARTLGPAHGLGPRPIAWRAGESHRRVGPGRPDRPEPAGGPGRPRPEPVLRRVAVRAGPALRRGDRPGVGPVGLGPRLGLERRRDAPPEARGRHSRGP